MDLSGQLSNPSPALQDYLGYTSFRGVEYPGVHESLITEETFQRVQDRLAENRGTGNRERKHLHYLAGSLYCGRCKSRLVYSVNTGRHGTAYEYFVCTGRQLKTTECDAPHLPVSQVEAAIERLWMAEHALWRTEALPAIRQRLSEHLCALRDDSQTSTSELQRRITAIQRDRYKWAEHAMDGVVPSDIAREKQTTLARQLAGLETELKALETAGIDTEATLHRVIDVISDPGHTYPELDLGLRRTYNQAWFTRIYLDAIPDEPDHPIGAAGERTVIADALEGSRQLIAVELESESSDPEGSADVLLLNLRHTGGVD